MITPKEIDIGRSVIYTGNRYPGGKPKSGRITSFSNGAVFVLYDGDKHSKATSRRYLKWAYDDSTWKHALSALR